MAGDDMLLERRIGQQSDDDLLAMVTRDYADYRADALTMARAELTRRGYDAAQMAPGSPSTSSFARMTDVIDGSRTELTEGDFAVPDLEARIRAEGLDAAAAAQMASRFVADEAPRRVRATHRQIGKGFLMVVAGGTLTLGSYVIARAAAEATGHAQYYSVFYGFMIVGALHTLLGVIRRRELVPRPARGVSILTRRHGSRGSPS